MLVLSEVEGESRLGLRNAIPHHIPAQSPERGVERGDESAVPPRRDASHKFVQLQKVDAAVLPGVEAFGEDVHPVECLGLFVPGGTFAEGGLRVEQEFGLH